MDYHDTLSVLLPAPRDDEPAGLRQDIIDELADHLTCAYHRELLRGTDRTAARARTLQRFGDPAAVARRLWLDAMKGKIMAQRIVIATCLLFMLICIWVVNLISQRSSQSASELTLANRRVIEYLSQTQATNQEMMRHLQAMDNAAQSRQQLESSTVAFRLTLEMPDGPPAAGFEVRFGTATAAQADPMLRMEPLTNEALPSSMSDYPANGNTRSTARTANRKGSCRRRLAAPAG